MKSFSIYFSKHFSKYLMTALTVAMVGTPAATFAAGKIRVVTTLPDLAEIVRSIGGDQVEVTSLLSGREDAHFLDAAPTYIRMVASADIVCLVGLDLEVGWLPKVLAKSGNSKVQPGGRGYCDTGKGVSTLEKPTGPVDRSMGDVHPAGNPHFNLSPSSLAEAAAVIAEELSEARPEAKGAFDQRLTEFRARMTELQKRIASKLKPAVDLSGKQPVVIEYHKEFTYFFHAYGIRSLGSIEEKPGVLPSAAWLAKIAENSRSSRVKVALVANYSPDNSVKKFTELSGIPVKKLPTAVQSNGAANSIEKLQDTLADALLSAVVTVVTPTPTSSATP